MTREENIKLREELTKYVFYHYTGYEVNLENPRTFNEKLQWLKLYYHDPLITKCADKYLVRDHIKEIIGEEYLIPLIGVWDNVDDIDFDSLPDQFVLKVNWGSGQNIVVKDKSKLNIEEAKEKLRNWMKIYNNHYYYVYEWSYKNIIPKILCESFMKNPDRDNLTVYKVFCLSGEPYLFQVAIDEKTSEAKINYYDLEWNKLDLKQNYENFDDNLPVPKNLNIMIQFARKLAKYFPYFVRVDFYEVNEKIYFSEYTFYSDAGIIKFHPEDWDLKLGNLINLPNEKKIEYDVIDRETLLNQLYNLEPLVKEHKELLDYVKVLTSNNQNISYSFKFITLFNIDLFSIEKSSRYMKITILGIKITLKRQSRAEQS